MILYHQLQVKNELGLHVRPAAKIAKILQPFEASVYFTCNAKTIDAKHAMEILLLEAKKHAEIEIQIKGRDAQKALNQLIRVFEKNFEEGV